MREKEESPRAHSALINIPSAHPSPDKCDLLFQFSMSATINKEITATAFGFYLVWYRKPLIIKQPKE